MQKVSYSFVYAYTVYTCMLHGCLFHFYIMLRTTYVTACEDCKETFIILYFTCKWSTIYAFNYVRTYAYI